MSLIKVPRLVMRVGTCLASGAAALGLMVNPAAAIGIDLQAPTIVCGTGAPYLALQVGISPGGGGFGATATAHVCNANAIETVVTLQAVGAGVTTSPSVAGGPIFFAPFEAKAGNDATASGYSSAPSATAQSVIVNVTGIGVGVLNEPTNSCQILYDRVLGQIFRLDGCNAAVYLLS